MEILFPVFLVVKNAVLMLSIEKEWNLRKEKNKLLQNQTETVLTKFDNSI